MTSLALLFFYKDKNAEVKVIADHEPTLQEMNSLLVEGTETLLKNLLRDHLQGADKKDPYFEEVGLKVLSYHQKLTKEYYERNKI